MTNELTHLSYSSIDTWLQCPAKWRFKYIHRIPVATAPALAFGTAFHATLRDFYTPGKAMNTDDLPGVWLEHFQAATKDVEMDWSGGLAEETVGVGMRLMSATPVLTELAALSPRIAADGQPEMEVPITLRVPGVPIPVIGFIDFIGTDGTLYDFKTAARAWSVDQAEGEAQPLFYLAGANQMGIPHRPGVFRHFVAIKSRTPKVEIHETPHTAAEVLWLFATVKGVWDAISAGLFPPSPKACFAYGQRCPYWSSCRGRK